MSFFSIGIRWRLGLTTLLSLVPMLLLGVALSVYLIVDITRQKNLYQEVTAFESINNVLTFETRMGDSDICVLAALPAVPDFFRARQPAVVDPVSGLPLDKELHKLAGLLSRFLVIKKVYDQVRLIDKSGQEVLRVNLTGAQAEVVPPARLQNKGDRYYFKEAAKLPPRGEYVSLIDLNQEHGKVAKPFKPMLRLAAPIYDEAGVFQGVVILNKYADRFLSQIMQVPEKIDGIWFIADEQGNYVYHTQDPNRLWGGSEDLNTGEGLSKDFPNAWRQILSGKSTSVLWQGQTWQVNPRRFNLWPSNSRFITVVHMTPQPGLTDYFRRDTWLLAGLALLAALLVGLLIWWNARRISQPILDLNRAVVQFSEGHWEARVPVTTRDEIANVCLNFNAMADKLGHLTENLEQEVRAQTEELQAYQDRLEKMVTERTAALRLANDQLEQEIVERRRGEQALRESEELYRSLFENMLNGFTYCKMLYDQDQPQDFIFLKVNNSFEPLTGLKDVVGKKISDVIPGIQESDPGLFKILGRVALTGKPEKTEIYLESLKMWGSISVYSPAKEYFVVVFDVITHRKRAEEEMQKLSTAVAQATDWVVITDKEGIIEYANEAAAAMSGYTKEELIGQNPRLLKSGQHDAQFYQELWTTIAAGNPFRTIFINRKKTGELFHLDMTITPLRDEKGNITKYLSTAKDITQQVSMEERLNYLAYYDPLTDLPNRTLFMDRLRQALARTNHSGRAVGVIAMDLDRFKLVNETFGPATGDEVLRSVGQRLAQTLREGDTVARLGSDEFGIILVDLDQTDDIVLVLDRIRESISPPIQAGEESLWITFSMGIAMYPQDGEDAPTLVQNADSAFAKAKEQGGNSYQFYTPGMNVKAANFLLLGNQLLNALHRQEFLLYYQPYYQVSTGKMVGMEALIRWRHPDWGIVPPGEFIPILEETGLIREVGEWTLQEACRQVREWQQQGHAPVPVSVNFSAVQFSWPGLVGMVERVLSDCGLDPHFLTAEITESAIMHNVEYTLSVLTRFKNLGMSVSIDDFGTGYSSLSYLKRFPIDNLKIDISFIREVTTDPNTAAIVQAIISMAHNLDLKTIAEGVETKEQSQILRLLHCDIIQGFYYSHPLPPEEFGRLSEAGSSTSS